MKLCLKTINILCLIIKSIFNQYFNNIYMEHESRGDKDKNLSP